MVMYGLRRLQLCALRIGSSGEGCVQFQTEPESARDEEQRSALRWDVRMNWGIRNCDTEAETAHRGRKEEIIPQHKAWGNGNKIF